VFDHDLCVRLGAIGSDNSTVSADDDRKYERSDELM
jgi:hypothetical protein